MATVETNEQKNTTTLPETQEKVIVAPKAAEIKPRIETDAKQTSVQDSTQDRINKLNKEEQVSLTVVNGLLEEYCGKVSRSSNLGVEAQPHFSKLHGAFKEMMSLRGSAHIEAARAFMEKFKTHGKTSLDYDMRCRHLDLLPRDHRIVFTGYMDLLCRFTKCSNKGTFRKTNDIDRVLSKVNDPALAESINSVFPG